MKDPCQRIFQRQILALRRRSQLINGLSIICLFKSILITGSITVVIVTTHHQQAAGIDENPSLKSRSMKYIIVEKMTIETIKNRTRKENSLTEVVIVSKWFFMDSAYSVFGLNQSGFVLVSWFKIKHQNFNLPDLIALK